MGGKRTKFTSAEYLSSTGSYDNSSRLPPLSYLYSFLFSSTFIASSHVAYLLLAYAHSGWKTNDAKKLAKPTCINKDDTQCSFSSDGGCEPASEYVDLLGKTVLDVGAY